MAAGENRLDATAVSSRTASWVGNGILFAWLAYLLIAPTIGFNWIESWHNEQRAAQVLLLVCTAIAFIPIAIACTPNAGQQTLQPWFPWWLFLVFALGAVSAVRSPNLFAGLAEVSLHVLLALLALMTAIVVSLDVERADRWARWFALLFSSAYVLGVATRYLAAVNLDRSIDLDVLILGYANPRFPSAFHALLMPFLAVMASDRGEPRWIRTASFVILALLWAINLGLGTRGIWFAYALGLPLTAFLLGWDRSKRLVGFLALGCTVGVCLYFVLFRIGPSMAGGSAVGSPIDNLSTVTSRDVLWRLGWEAITASPFLGIGPMQFATFGTHVGAHPHNWVLQIASEWGLIATALLIWGVCRTALKVRAARVELKLSAPLLAVSCALVLALVDGNLVMPVSQSGFLLVLGLLLGSWFRQCRADQSTASGRLPTTLTLAAGASASVLLVYFAAATFDSQPSAVSRFQHAHPGAWLVPRFWEQGSL
jgi:O-antigen ligase